MVLSEDHQILQTQYSAGHDVMLLGEDHLDRPHKREQISGISEGTHRELRKADGAEHAARVREGWIVGDGGAAPAGGAGAPAFVHAAARAGGACGRGRGTTEHAGGGGGGRGGGGGAVRAAGDGDAGAAGVVRGDAGEDGGRDGGGGGGAAVQRAGAVLAGAGCCGEFICWSAWS